MKTSQTRRAREKAQKRSRAEWLEEVSRWRASGEDAVCYSTRHGLNPRTLTWWASQLRDELRRPSTSAPVAPRLFVAVRESSRPETTSLSPTSVPTASSIEIALVNGLRLRVIGEVSTVMLARVLDVAQGAGPRC